jgi:hypothetical protein
VCVRGWHHRYHLPNFSGSVRGVSREPADASLHTIPGSRAYLHRVFLGGQNILITYTSGKARVWNSDTGEFRRSTRFDAAEEMLNESEWVEVYVTPSVNF